MQNNCTLINGDCLKEIPKLTDNSIDLCLTDPPYGLEFMGKSWDKWEENFNYKWATAVFPKLKPGAFLVFTMTPRQDLLWRCLAGIEKAGYQLQTSGMYWLYHTGFPKALDISKAIDKQNGRTQQTFIPFGKYLKEKRTEKGLSMNQIDSLLETNTAYSWWEGRKAGIQLPSKKLYLKLKQILELDNRFDKLIERIEAERELVGINKNIKGRKLRNVETLNVGAGAGNNTEITNPALNEARKWQGWKSFQLKPAVECVVVAQKPRTQKTITAQVLDNGCGAVNIGECRIPYANNNDANEYDFNRRGVAERLKKDFEAPFEGGWQKQESVSDLPQGRFPANLIVQNQALTGEETTSKGGTPLMNNAEKRKVCYGEYKPNTYFNCGDRGSPNRFYDIDRWAKKRNITLTEDSAFFDVPKPSKGEKNGELEYNGFEEKNAVTMGNDIGGKPHNKDNPRLKRNIHPTCKPITLFRYLATMFCQTNGTILDPFMGSGTTGISCLLENKKFIGIEKDKEYFKIAQARTKPHQEQTKL